MKKIDSYSIVILVFTVISIIQGTTRLCVLDDLSGDTGCNEFETCSQLNHTFKYGICDCKPDYQRSSINNTCIYLNPEESALKSYDEMIPTDIPIKDDSTNTLTIIVLSLLTLLFCFALVFTAYIGEKKYRFITKLRSRLYPSATNYDDFMIGREDDDDDDPPIA